MEKEKTIIQQSKQKSIQDLLEFSILNIDKPSGPTSFDISHHIMKRLNLKKTCHFGTLDPLVTGVLPIGLSRACKLSEYFLKKDKTYTGVMNIHKDISEEQLKKEIKSFLGKIKQTPPKRSSVLRKERERTIYEFEILEKNKRDVLFKVRCEAGTYIRKLCHDLGEKIRGAHMTQLRRIQAGIFSDKDKTFVSLSEFENAVQKYQNKDESELRRILIPGEIICNFLPKVQIKNDKDIIKKLYNGYKLTKEMSKEKIKFKKDEKIAVFCDNIFIGVYKMINQDNIIARSEFVFKPTLH
jgi:H/ACA ribonucleoprotein complex subunit 4